MSEISPLRVIYGLLFTLCLPLVIARVYWRARKEPRYKEDLKQRFGYAAETAHQPVWVHGVSAGETIAAGELVRRLVAAGHRVQDGGRHANRVVNDCVARLSCLGR